MGNFTQYNERWAIPPDPTIPTPTDGPEDDRTITVRTLGITFETIVQNIAAFPYTVIENSVDKMTKTYYLPNDETITVVTEIISDTIITKTITGDTGLAYDMRKLRIEKNTNQTDVVYEIIEE